MQKAFGIPAVYGFLGPIQKLPSNAVWQSSLLTICAKRQLEDDIDTIIGSQGKCGSADHVPIYARKGKKKMASSRSSGREIEEHKFVLSWWTDIWNFSGKEKSMRSMQSKTRSSAFLRRNIARWAFQT